jgi:hypothetical protein
LSITIEGHDVIQKEQSIVYRHLPAVMCGNLTAITTSIYDCIYIFLTFLTVLPNGEPFKEDIYILI